MNKYCPICGIENLEEAAFCIKCGASFGASNPINNAPYQQETNNGAMPQYYGQTQQYTPQRSKSRMKPIIAIIGTVVIVAILIGALLFSGALDGVTNSEEDINKISVDGGPQANLESLVSGGNVLTTPAQGHTAVYGYYMSGSKIGEIYFTGAGEAYYDGKYCDKIIGGGNLNLEVYGQTVGMDFDLTGYVDKTDSILTYSTYNFNFDKPVSMDMDMTLDFDKYEGEITFTISSSMTGSQSTVIEVSDDYWDMQLSEEDLYVGYIDEIQYTMSVEGYDVAMILRIKVVAQEDITVPKGTFQDCYRIEIEQTETLTLTTTTSKVWIDENYICPKMEIDSDASSLGYGDMTIELEEYYTTQTSASF